MSPTRQPAKLDLALRNPEYVKAFEDNIDAGLDAAMQAAELFLKPEPWWDELLSGLLAVELAMDEARTALKMVTKHRGDGIDDGRLVEYHTNHLIFQVHALLEKSKYLLTRVYRTLVKRIHSDSYRDELAAVVERIGILSEKYGNVRHPLVHPRGGLASAPAQDRLWEAHVLIDYSIADTAGSYFARLPNLRARWANMLRSRMIVVLAELDAAFTQAVKDSTTAHTKH